MPGILNSRIGHLNGNEVVEVEYDSARIDLKLIADALKAESSFYALVALDENAARAARSFWPEREIKTTAAKPHFVESKYSLHANHPDLYYLDLTEAQAMALNSWSYLGGKMPEVLTPAQKELRREIQKRLTTKSPARLRPVRSGAGLAVYRQQLLDWLEN